MNNAYQFVVASTLSLEDFVQLFNQSFQNYFYPIELTAEKMAARILHEQLDLYRSVVLMHERKAIGQATLALRGNQAWCGGFGIVPEYRGKGLAASLFKELVNQAQLAGAKHLSLEVLHKNIAAQNVYLAGGMQKIRELRLLEWAKEETSQSTDQALEFTETKPMDSAEIASVFYGLHSVAACWQRDLPSLLLLPELLQINCLNNGKLAGYALFATQENTARIYDIGTPNTDMAVALLKQLQAQFKKIHSVNEAANNPWAAAFDQCGFVQYDYQFELSMAL